MMDVLGRSDTAMREQRLAVGLALDSLPCRNGEPMSEAGRLDAPVEDVAIGGFDFLFVRLRPPAPDAAGRVEDRVGISGRVLDGSGPLQAMTVVPVVSAIELAHARPPHDLARLRAELQGLPGGQLGVGVVVSAASGVAAGSDGDGSPTQLEKALELLAVIREMRSPGVASLADSIILELPAAEPLARACAQLKAQIGAIRKSAAMRGHPVNCLLEVDIACFATEREAGEYRRWLSDARQDDSLDDFLSSIIGDHADDEAGDDQAPSPEPDPYRLIGTPDQLADGLRLLGSSGCDGIVASLSGGSAGADFFGRNVLPLMLRPEAA